MAKSRRWQNLVIPLLINLIFMPAAMTQAQSPGKRQVCEGIVAFDADGSLLLMDVKKTSSLWCGAYIGEDRNSIVAQQLLAKCPVGARCRVDGLFVGHGVFYWTTIFSAKKS